MKLLFTFAILSAAYAAPAILDDNTENTAARSAYAGAQIVRYFYDHRGLDGYKFTYELSDGQIRSEEGAYKDGQDANGNPVKILVVQGAYSWVAPDGETYWVNYQSDENGYRPTVGKGLGGIRPGEDANIDPNLLKSLVG